MSIAAASQYCGTSATQRAGNQTPRVSLVKQSRGRSRDPGSVFGRVITNRKSLQAGHRRLLPSFVYKGVWFECTVIKLHNGLQLQNPVSVHFYMLTRFFTVVKYVSKYDVSRVANLTSYAQCNSKRSTETEIGVTITAQASAKDVAWHKSTLWPTQAESSLPLRSPATPTVWVSQPCASSLSHCTQNAIFVRSRSLAKLVKKEDKSL